MSAFRRLLLTAAACVTLAGPAFAGERWYLAHVGAETCVPLDDLNNDLSTRSYYGTGDMRTPKDYAARMRAIGFSLADQPFINDGVVSYMASYPGVRTVLLVVFKDHRFCEAFMAQQPR